MKYPRCHIFRLFFGALPFAAGFFASGLSLQAEEAEVAVARVSNPSGFARQDVVVTIPFSRLGLEPEEASGLAAFIAGTAVPLQRWDEDGDGESDSVSVLIDLEPAQTVDVALILSDAADSGALPRVQAEISHKVGGEWNGRVYEGGTFQNVDTLTPPAVHTDHSFYIRYEGPGIESDKVGYRFYLDWRNGFDVFGKTTPERVLQKVGQDSFDSYHKMSDWGMDILKVGNSVGAGGFGYWNGEAIERVSELEGWTCDITANGPIVAGLKTLYRGWKADGQTMDLTSRLRMDAGSRIAWVTLDSDAVITPLAAGLVKHPDAERMQGPTDVPMASWMYLATYGPQTLHGDDLLGMAIVFRQSIFSRFVEDEYNDAVEFRRGHQRIEYGLLAAWDREPGGIQSKEAFQAYLDETIERLNLPVRVTLRLAETRKKLSGALSAASVGGWTTQMDDTIVGRQGASLSNGH